MAMIVTSTSDNKDAANATKDAVLATEKPAVDTKSAPEVSASGETTEESDTAETDLEETQSPESTSTAEGDEEEIEAKDDGEKAPKKKGGFQKRIERFQKTISSKDLAISKKDMEIEYLRQEVAKAKQPAQTDQTVVEKKEILGKPKADNFDSHEEYVDALTDWKLEAKDKEREQKAKETQIKTEFQAKGQAFQTRINEFKKANDDFDELMEGVDGDIIVPIHVQEVFMSSENGPALMYELAKDQKELARISSLSPTQAILAMGKLEAKFAKTQAQSTSAKTTKVPAPISPVGGKGGSIKKSIDDPSLSQREYEKLREQQMKAART